MFTEFFFLKKGILLLIIQFNKDILHSSPIPILGYPDNPIYTRSNENNNHQDIETF